MLILSLQLKGPVIETALKVSEWSNGKAGYQNSVTFPTWVEPAPLWTMKLVGLFTSS